MKKLGFLSAAIISSFLLSSCAMLAPKNFSEYKEGEWQGKVLVHDKRESKRGLVNVKVKAVDGEKLRMDITSPVGTHLASILLNGEKMEYLNVQEKTVYQTAHASRDSLREFLKLPIEPKYLYNVFFDRPIVQKTWSCTSDASGLLQNCKDRQTGLVIDWISREGAKRTISLEHSAASVQINLYDFSSSVGEPEKSFVLKTPSSFKVKKI